VCCQVREKFPLKEIIARNCFPEGAKLQLQGSKTSCSTCCSSLEKEMGQPKDC
jgi:hypothetical protein